MWVAPPVVQALLEGGALVPGGAVAAGSRQARPALASMILGRLVPLDKSVG